MHFIPRKQIPDVKPTNIKQKPIETTFVVKNAKNNAIKKRRKNKNTNIKFTRP